MEPVTHLLFGANMSRAGMNRTTGLATLTVTLAAEAPDIDVVVNVFGPVTGFAHHRGMTHTFLGVPFMALLTVAFVYLLYRYVPWVRRRTKLPPRWGLLTLWAMVGGLSHILLDFTNNYGVRPLSPFLHKWWSWDIVFIIEPIMWIALGGSLILPALFALVQEEIGARKQRFRGRGAAIAALLIVGVMWGVRDYQHSRAVAILQNSLYEGEPPLRVSAYPYYLNPFRWYAVVETETFFQTSVLNTRTEEIDAEGRAVIRYKPEETPVSLAAKKTRLGQVYLDWAAYPYVRVDEVPGAQGGYVVHFRDLRFAYPERGENILGASVTLDRNLKVVEQRMGRRAEHAVD